MLDELQAPLTRVPVLGGRPQALLQRRHHRRPLCCGAGLCLELPLECRGLELQRGVLGTQGSVGVCLGGRGFLDGVQLPAEGVQFTGVGGGGVVCCPGLGSCLRMRLLQRMLSMDG